MPTTLDKTKDSRGNLCYIITQGTDEILVDVDDYQEAKQLELHRNMIVKHARKGRKHFKRYLKDIERQRGLSRLKREDREREESRIKIAEDKLRKEQARLAKIEACRCRDPYWFDITWRQMFKGWS